MLPSAMSSYRVMRSRLCGGAVAAPGGARALGDSASTKVLAPAPGCTQPVTVAVDVSFESFCVPTTLGRAGGAEPGLGAGRCAAEVSTVAHAHATAVETSCR